MDIDETAIHRYEEFKRLRLNVRKMDLQSAATAIQHGGTNVTRNVRDFDLLNQLVPDGRVMFYRTQSH